MPYRNVEEWRMRIILSVAWQEIQPVVKLTADGEQLACFTYDLDGDGLIQIASTLPESNTTRTYRFDKYGGLRNVFDSHANNGREEAIYSRFGEAGKEHRHQVERDSSEMIGRLEKVILLERAEELLLANVRMTQLDRKC